MHEQLIIFGAPGTGKSFEVEQRIRHSKNKVFRVTIHPEYMYTDFVGQLLPVTLVTGAMKFEFKEGPFTSALMEAYADSSKEVFLIIEELSRGNVSAIFGDIFQLLDRDEHFVSRYPIRNKNIADKIPTLINDEIKLPSNFNIICTVNMNDQNVFPMDTAFKRRFDWEYVSCEPAIDKSTGSVNKKLNNPKILVAIDNSGTKYIETNWQSFYMALNTFITDKENGLGRKEDKQVGQFFVNFGTRLTEDSYSSVKATADKAQKIINVKIKNKLLNYLWQDIERISTFGSKVKLFDKTINSYDDLYKKFGIDKVFSSEFIDNFLEPNKLNYKY